MNRYQDALQACEKAIKLDPEFAEAQILAGNILVALQRDKDAIPYYKKAIELEPAKEDIYLHLAIAI
ncbi:tetratricopeptide repeat protein [Geotalea toluenoxydans]|uniref:tetratricopeptide repeat protein n=1 Tax=Geotalea toluenoxydans TaxID=421624 RepID=UPI000A3F9B5C|nr:tetratricopeptide repeat protein [Geotalea toluenoxydans]